MATILSADDAAFLRMRSAALLNELEHEVIEAEDGVQALDLQMERRPDAVLRDITMPEMDGLEALKKISSLGPRAKVATVTAPGQQQVVIEAIKAGARDLVVKPFDAGRIQAALWTLMP